MSHQSIRRGAFILFEGIDRCGKTTQSKLLAETLRKEGSKIEMMRFPDRTTTVGKMIDAYLKMGIDLHDKAIHLLFSANRWELAYVSAFTYITVGLHVRTRAHRALPTLEIPSLSPAKRPLAGAR